MFLPFLFARVNYTIKCNSKEKKEFIPFCSTEISLFSTLNSFPLYKFFLSFYVRDFPFKIALLFFYTKDKFLKQTALRQNCRRAVFLSC